MEHTPVCSLGHRTDIIHKVLVIEEKDFEQVLHTTDLLVVPVINI